MIKEDKYNIPDWMNDDTFCTKKEPTLAEIEEFNDILGEFDDE